MVVSVRTLRRTLLGAALVGIAGIASLPAVGTADPAARAPVPYSACGDLQTKPDGTAWTCSFADDFDGSSLDPSKWITQDTRRTGFSTEQTCLVATDRTIGVSAGTLQLTARDDGDPFDCGSRLGPFTTEYTGAMVGTRTRFSQAYGKFEMRAKFPTARTPGVHGGFWMNPLAMTYGAWPRSGEIDIAEWWSKDPTLVMPSLHYPGRNSDVDSGWSCRVDQVTKFHTYAVVWSPTGLRFYIDGRLCFRRLPDPSDPTLVAPQPFDKPFSIVLNMGVGTKTGDNKVSDRTQLPATLTIDYVRAWR